MTDPRFMGYRTPDAPLDPPEPRDHEAEAERQARIADAWHDDRDERRIAAEQAAGSVRSCDRCGGDFNYEPCEECGGDGWITGQEHHIRCDGSCEAGLCPVPVQLQCPSCGGYGLYPLCRAADRADDDNHDAEARVAAAEQREEWCEVRVRRDFIPKGAVLVEAYETAGEIIVLGCPSDGDDHNCDAMGCGTLSHVMHRFRKPAAAPASDQ